RVRRARREAAAALRVEHRLRRLDLEEGARPDHPAHGRRAGRVHRVMPLVAANGLQFHVQELGDGPPVVMVHGLLIGSLASWDFTVARALAPTHRCRLYDLRGHGRSERALTGYDVATMTADLAALTADLAAPFDLVGHSFGGVVALAFALAHPARV